MIIQENDKKGMVDLFNDCLAEKPSKGKIVRVVEGKKHKGKEGRVFWHGKDKFSKAFDFCNDIAATMRECNGTYGFRVGIQEYNGEKFFVSAEYVEIIK